MVERDAEPSINVSLDLVLTATILLDRNAIGMSRQFRRRAVFVRTAKKKNLMPGLAPETGVDIGGQQRTSKISQMLHAVDIGQRAS